MLLTPKGTKKSTLSSCCWPAKNPTNHCCSVRVGVSPGSILPIPFSSHRPPSVLLLRPQNNAQLSLPDGRQNTERRRARQDKEDKNQGKPPLPPLLAPPTKQERKRKSAAENLKQRKSWTKPADKHE